MTKRTMITLYCLSIVGMIIIPLAVDLHVQGYHRIQPITVMMFILGTIGLRKGLRANASEVTDEKK